MTDAAERELRTVLAERAAAVTVDPAAGEQAIADRLLAGDHSLAEVVPLAARSRRVWWLAGVAAAVLAVVIGALALTNDDHDVQTVPVAPPSGTPSSTVTTPDTAPTSEDPLVAREGESAKDVAERVARQVFPADEYVTTTVEDAPYPPSSPGTQVVTMEGQTSGDTLVGYVSPGPDGRGRLGVLTHPALDGHVTTVMTNGQPTGIDLNGVELPTDRVVVMSVGGLDDELIQVGRIQVPVIDAHAAVTADWWRSAHYLAFELRAADGTMLRALQPVPTGD